MLEYKDLNDDEKRTFREVFKIERVGNFYLEDHKIMLMNPRELFEYLYLLDTKKIKDLIAKLNNFLDVEIKDTDVNKTICKKIIESNSGVHKIGEEIYAYKESSY